MQSKLKIQEIQVKSILTNSKLPEADYVINPYTGCMHACPYCYAVFIKRFTNHKEKWGEFVDVKINAPEILEKEIRKAKPGNVLLSSVTDAYHPIERKYKITRKILEILLQHQFPISILTKSDLVLRDIDLLKQFKDAIVGFSFMSFNASYSKEFEPLTSPPERRLEAIRQLNKAGIKTYAFLGPIFPELTTNNLEEIFKKFSELNLEYIFCENLNHKAGTWNEIMQVIKSKYPQLEKPYQEIFFTKNNYWQNIESKCRALAKKYNLKEKIYFHHNN